MAGQELLISADHLQRLLAAANGDAALLYLYLSAGRPPEQAAEVLRMRDSAVELAFATLRQMGLWTPSETRHIRAEQPPAYTVQDVIREKQTSAEFGAIIGDVQRRIGRILNDEELKTLLSIYRYLGLAPEVISVLFNFCVSRNASRGVSRMPSLRTVEKEAYRWADAGIDTLEQAAAFVQHQTVLQNHRKQIRELLGITDRNLTSSEERMADSWLEWGFTEKEIQLAYNKTCMNTGGLKWPYLHSILKSWHTQGLHSVAQIETGDTEAPRRQSASAAKASYGVQHHNDPLNELQLAAIRRMLEEKEE